MTVVIVANGCKEDVEWWNGMKVVEGNAAETKDALVQVDFVDFILRIRPFLRDLVLVGESNDRAV